MSQIASLLGKGGSMPSNEVLVEIKAGKMFYDGKKVTPDKKRGTIKIIRDFQGVKSFQWIEAGANNPFQNIMIFPGDAKFVKVKQSKDRVYLLELLHSKHRHFFWFQEKDETEDAERCKKIHNWINGIEGDITMEPVKETTRATKSADGPSTRISSTTQPPNPGTTQNYNDLLASFLSQSNMSKMAEGLKKPSCPSLNSVVSSDAKNKVLEDEKAWERLYEHCPDNQHDINGLKESIHSPQLKHAMSSLEAAIESGQGHILLRQMGIDPNNPGEYAEIVELFNNIAKGA